MILRPFYVSGNPLVIVNRSNRVTALFLNTPITQRQPTRQRTTNVTEINKRALGSKYLSGNNLPRINVIRGKVFPDKYLHAIGGPTKDRKGFLPPKRTFGHRKGLRYDMLCYKKLMLNDNIYFLSIIFMDSLILKKDPFWCLKFWQS